MVLVDLLSGFKGIFDPREQADIDSPIFKLHYKITTVILFTFCLVVTAESLVGEPINCARGKDERLSYEVINSYCWIHTTFTLPKFFHRNTGRNSPAIYPGIGTDQEEDDKIYHAYYQWVPFVLFLQGIMYYAPHWLWKMWEGGKMNSMVLGLSNPVMEAEEKKDKIKLLADYLYVTLNLHNIYAIRFLICEFLNLLNCLFSFWFLDTFLGGMFLKFGIEVASYLQRTEETRSDPLILLFPRVTKCSFYIFGPSGTPENYDFICILALNIINEKIFIFLWFWVVTLIFITSFALLYRCLVFFLPSIRMILLNKKARSTGLSKTLTTKLQIGDYFILHLLSKNIEFLAFNSLVEELYLRLSSKGMKEDIEMAQSFLQEISS